MNKSSATFRTDTSAKQRSPKGRRSDRKPPADRRRLSNPLRLELLEDRSLLSAGVGTAGALAASMTDTMALAAEVNSIASATVSDVASAVSISSPSVTATTSADKTIITWSVTAANGIGSVTLMMDGKTVSISKTLIDKNDANYSYSAKLAAGTHAYAITATDSSGDSASHIGTLTVAGTTPTITGLTAKATTSAKATTIAWSVNDIDGINSVVLTVDGVAATGVKRSGSGTSARYSYSGKLAAGTHVYSVTVTDIPGQSTMSGGVVAVAGTTPTIAKVKVSTASSVGSTTTISWNVTDIDGIGSVVLAIDGRAVSSSSIAQSGSGATVSFTYTAALTGGKHSYAIVAIDSAGVVSKTSQGTFKVKASTPTISGVTVVNTTSPVSTTIQWNAYDIDGIQAVTLSIDGRSVGITQTSGDAFSAGYSYTGVLTAKNHSYAIKVVDVAGMTSQSTGTFTVAAVVPTISNVVVSSITSLVATTITCNVADASGISTVALALNGAAANMTKTSGDNYSAAYSYSAILAAGTYTYKITTVNAQGATATAGGTFTVLAAVTMAPAISSVSVASTTAANASTVTWNVTAANGISTVELTVNHEAATVTKTSGTNYSSDYSFSAMLAAGAYNYRITATDTLGKTATFSGMFTVASVPTSTAPTISNVAVSSTTSLSTTTITWNVADLDGIGSVSLTLNDTAVTVTKASGNYYSAGYSYSEILAAGVYNYTIAATDAEGNSATYDGTFTVASSPVSSALTISNVAVSSTTSASTTTITWDVADSDGIGSVALTLNGTAATVTKTSGTDYSASYSYSGILAEGSYTYRITATDTQGETAASSGVFAVAPSSTTPSVSTTSTNWSGYGVETSLADPSSAAVTYVTGSWIVPTVVGSGEAYCAVWVGIDGYESTTVEQIGTDSDTYNGTAYYYAWYEMYPDYPVTISSMTISPGDSITASVRYITTGTYTGRFLLSITDNTNGQSFSIYKTMSNAARSSAEWIVEVPSSDSGVLSLAYFSPVTFTNAYATINGLTGPIDSSSWENAAINLVSSTGTTLAATSALTDSGSSSSFTVTRTNAVSYASAAIIGESSKVATSVVAVAASPRCSAAIAALPQATDNGMTSVSADLVWTADVNAGVLPTMSWIHAGSRTGDPAFEPENALVVEAVEPLLSNVSSLPPTFTDATSIAWTTSNRDDSDTMDLAVDGEAVAVCAAANDSSSTTDGAISLLSPSSLAYAIVVADSKNNAKAHRRALEIAAAKAASALSAEDFVGTAKTQWLVDYGSVAAGCQDGTDAVDAVFAAC